jgi:spore germination protein YaaH
MTGRTGPLLTLVVALSATGCASAGGPAPVLVPTAIDRPFVAGYHVYWAGDAWLDYPLDMLDELHVFEIEVGADGGVEDSHGWPTEWRGLVAEAVDAGVQVVPTVSLHDAAAFEALFADAARIERLVGTVLDLLAMEPRLSGIHLDFEVFQPVDVAARDGFTAFVAELAAELRGRFPGKSLSVFALAFDDDDVYNERALGQLVDYLVVQGYDYHELSSPNAGPVGALRGWGRLNWEHVVDRFTSFGIPRRKLVMGLPLYGYEWPVASDEPGAERVAPGEPGAERVAPGVIVPYAADPDVVPELPRAREQAERHGVLRDPVSGSPYYVFRRPSGWVQGWFEDAESLAAKIEFVRARGLGGVALFPLAYGIPELFEALREALGPGR